jgi:hypothetical protein
MPDMTAVINRNPADIDTHLGRIQRDKKFFLLGLGIIDTKGHFKKAPMFN